MIDGEGLLKWPSGKYYTGQWQGNQMSGQGYLRWPDGKEYFGQFKNDS